MTKDKPAEGETPAFSGPPGQVVSTDGSLPRNAQAKITAHPRGGQLTAAAAAGEIVTTAKQEAIERRDKVKEVEHTQHATQAPQIHNDPKFAAQHGKTAPGVQANPGNKIMDSRRAHYGQPQGKGTS